MNITSYLIHTLPAKAVLVNLSKGKRSYKELSDFATYIVYCNISLLEINKSKTFQQYCLN